MNDWSILSPTQVTEVEICRNNLFAVFRLSIKTVIDLYFVNLLNENSPELHNFLVIFEKILSFNFKSASHSPSPWHYIRYCDAMTCQKSQNGKTGSRGNTNGVLLCEIFDQVDSLETKASTDKTRLRIWARLCLMHKSFAQHFKILCSQNYDVINSFYGQMSMFHLKEQMTMVCDDLVGLNALDLTFQLKGEDFSNYVYIVDYSTYLQFSQCQESQMIDRLESERLKASKLNSTSADINGAISNGNKEPALGEEMTIYTQEFEDDLLGYSRSDTLINQDSSWAINMMLNDHMEAIALNNSKPANGRGSPPIACNSKTNGISSPARSANGSEAASRCTSSVLSNSSNLFVELVNQKSYLEELLSNRDSKIEEMKLENGRLAERLSSSSSETETLANQYEDIILELQQQVMDLQQQLSVAKKSEQAVVKSNLKSPNANKNPTPNKNTSSSLQQPVEFSQRVRKTSSGCVKKVALPL